MGVLLIRSDPGRHPENLSLVHDEDPLRGEAELDPVEGPGGRPLEVGPVPLEPAAVAGELELVLRACEKILQARTAGSRTVGCDVSVRANPPNPPLSKGGEGGISRD